MPGSGQSDMGYNSGSSKGSTGQWLKYWQEQDAKKLATTPPTGVSGQPLLRTTQIAGPGGTTSFESQYGPDPAASRLAELRLQAQLSADNASRSLAEREAANIRAMLALQRTSSSGGGPLPPRIGETPGLTGGIAGNEAAARAAAFARAKEQAGQSAQASLSGLRGALSRRGLASGGYANMKTAQALMPAADQLQDFSREQMISDFNRSSEIADRDVATGLATRGQDITQRGQDINANTARQNSLIGLFSAGKLY